MWRRSLMVAGWLFVGAAWLVAALVVFPRVPKTGSDFGIFIDAARALRIDSGQSIYQTNTLLLVWHQQDGCSLWGGPHGGGPEYVYPPLLANLLEPLSILPCAASTYIWHAFNLVLWGLCVAALAWRARAAGPWAVLAVAGISTAFLPLVQGLIIGQVHVIILASCLGASLLVERERPYSAGAVLAFGAFIKYFPAFLVLYYVLRGQWRVAVGAAIGGAILTALQIVLDGPQLFFEAFGGSATSVANQSHGVWLSVIPGGLALAVLVGVAFVAGLIWTARRGITGRGDEPLGLGWALCTMLLISPLVWWFYLTWLLPAFAACLMVALNPRQARAPWRRWLPIALLALAYGLICLRMLSPSYEDVGGALAALILWALTGVLYLRSAGLSFALVQPSRKVHTRQFQEIATRIERA